MESHSIIVTPFIYLKHILKSNKHANGVLNYVMSLFLTYNAYVILAKCCHKSMNDMTETTIKEKISFPNPKEQ